MFTFTPELLQKGLMGLGIAAGQLKHIDEGTKKALGRFVMAAVASGDANGFIKERLHWLEERDREPERPSTSVRASSRVVPAEAEFDDDQRSARPRRK